RGQLFAVRSKRKVDGWLILGQSALAQLFPRGDIPHADAVLVLTLVHAPRSQQSAVCRIGDTQARSVAFEPLDFLAARRIHQADRFEVAHGEGLAVWGEG